MKKYTDPTYLRTIHDGLNSGVLLKGNATSLPIGLVGIYEDAIPLKSSVNERKKFLDFFSVWALMKKEVSLEFVIPLLEGWTEEQLLDYIAQYSKWFNSPVSGKYQLYHERLRVFVIQKISHKQFAACNDIIIKQCQNALQLQNGSEWERYALEHLSKNLLLPSIEQGNSDELKKIAYNTTHWNRQIEISKGFEWSGQMLNEMMLWASKYNDDEVIECALNKVDLHYQEQNDASRIIELVANNDIETALQRIESFGGNDKEGLQRKFILYMLCLMELTLLESKNKPFSKDATEKLLKHLDDNLPVDHSVLNWNDFFPSYLCLSVLIDLIKIGVNVECVFKRTVQYNFKKLLLNDFNYRHYIKNFKLFENYVKTNEDNFNRRVEDFISELFRFKADDEMIEILLTVFPDKNDYLLKELLIINFKTNSIIKSEALFDKIIDTASKFIVIDKILSELKSLAFEPFNLLLDSLFNKIDVSLLVNDELKCKYWHLKAKYFYIQDDVDLAKKALNQSLGFLPLVSSKKIDFLRSSIIPEVYYLIGREYALQLLDDITKIVPKMIASKFIIRSICADGDVSEAHRICLKNKNPFENVFLYVIIAKYELLKNGLSKGIRTLKLIPQESRGESVVEVIQFLLKHSRTDYAIELCHELYFEENKCEANMYISEFYLKNQEFKQFQIYKNKIITPHVKLDLFVRSLSLLGIEKYRSLGLENEFAIFSGGKEIAKNKKYFNKYLNYLIQNGLFDKAIVLFENSLNLCINDLESNSNALRRLVYIYSENHSKLLIILNYINTIELSKEMMVMDAIGQSMLLGNIEKVEELKSFIKDPLFQLEFDCYWAYGLFKSVDVFNFILALDKVEMIYNDYIKLKKKSSAWAFALRYHQLKLDEVMIKYYVPLFIRAKVEDSVLMLLINNHEPDLHFAELSKFFILNDVLDFDWHSDYANTIKHLIKEACKDSEFSSKIKTLMESAEISTNSNIQTISIDELKVHNIDIKSAIELLQLYSLHQLIFDNINYNKISRYNKTLNLQWAIDIKNKFFEKE